MNLLFGAIWSKVDDETAKKLPPGFISTVFQRLADIIDELKENSNEVSIH